MIGLGTVVEGELVGPMNWLSKDWLVRTHPLHLNLLSKDWLGPSPTPRPVGLCPSLRAECARCQPTPLPGVRVVLSAGG